MQGTLPPDDDGELLPFDAEEAAKLRKVTHGPWPGSGDDPLTRALVKLDADGAWKHDLLMTAGSKRSPARVECNAENLTVILRECPAWQGVIQYDEFALQPMLAKPLPVLPGETHVPQPGQWYDYYDAMVGQWLARVVGKDPSRQARDEALLIAARRARIHPLRAWLEGLKWDGMSRCELLLPQFLGADDSRLHRAWGIKWMVSAVARVMLPGCQADHMLVLEGPQGIGKSSAVRTLVGQQWLRSGSPDLDKQRDAGQLLRGCWVYELGELDVLRGKARGSQIKDWLTRTVDSYRPPYERNPVDVPRQCVFVGTTNEAEWMRDETGGRRFWPVRCGAIDLPALAATRDQLWAEAVHRWRAQEPWHITDAPLLADAMAAQSERLEEHPWVSVIEHGLEELNLVRKMQGLTTGYILKVMLNAPGGSTGTVGLAMKALGWTKRRPRSAAGKREWRYYPPESDPVQVDLYGGPTPGPPYNDE